MLEPPLNRRRWLAQGCAHCALLWAGAAAAQSTLPGAWQPPPRFARPDNASDEGGLWAMMDREETRLRRSPFRMREAGLQEYLQALACKLAGEHCPDMRVYPVRVPFFNASMAPNGMMQVWSGLLLRVENEAQLAAVLAHEVGHFLQRHTLERLRDAKTRSAFAPFLAAFGIFGLAGQIALVAGGFGFSRDQEREADQISVALLQKNGYDAREASRIWANLSAELAANPATDPAKGSPMFATHPGVEERASVLAALAGERTGDLGETSWQRVIGPLRFELLADEVKRARPAESLVLIERLLEREPGGAELLYYRGEVRRLRNADRDVELALADFEAAARATDGPAVAWRALGQLHLAQSRPEPGRAALRRYLERAPHAPDADLIKHQIEEGKPAS